MVKKDSQTSFRPYYVNECEDIKFTIKQIASQFNKDPDTLDFILQAITTYTKNLHDYAPEPLKDNEDNEFLENLNNI